MESEQLTIIKVRLSCFKVRICVIFQLFAKQIFGREGGWGGGKQVLDRLRGKNKIMNEGE